MSHELQTVEALSKEILKAESTETAEHLLMALGNIDKDAELALRNLVESSNNDIVSKDTYEQTRQLMIDHHIAFSMDNRESNSIWGQKKLHTKVFLHKVYHRDLIEALRLLSSHIVFNGGSYPEMDELPTGLNEKDSYDVWRGTLID